MKLFSRLQWFSVVVITLVLGAVVTGFFVAGSPGRERERKFDEQRVSDLKQISSNVDQYTNQHGSVPGQLSLLTSEQGFSGSLVDPVTDAAYEYRATGTTTYELCATFAQGSVAGASPALRAPVPVFKSRTWSHGPGQVCFSLDTEAALPRIVCGLRNPCAAGQTCAVLHQGEAAVCVPQGKECLAAGCSTESCAVTQSYPAEVHCPVASSQCALMQETSSGRVQCFGCVGTHCTPVPVGWKPYSVPTDPGYVGVPYRCFVKSDGQCALAQ